MKKLRCILQRKCKGGKEMKITNEEAMKEYIKQLEFKKKNGLPESAKPIKDLDVVNGLGDTLSFVPLCPHCKEWSYYTINEADTNGGYTVCPFCEGLMYDEKYFTKTEFY